MRATLNRSSGYRTPCVQREGSVAPRAGSYSTGSINRSYPALATARLVRDSAATRFRSRDLRALQREQADVRLPQECNRSRPSVPKEALGDTLRSAGEMARSSMRWPLGYDAGAACPAKMAIRHGRLGPPVTRFDPIGGLTYERPHEPHQRRLEPPEGLGAVASPRAQVYCPRVSNLSVGIASRP